MRASVDSSTAAQYCLQSFTVGQGPEGNSLGRLRPLRAKSARGAIRAPSYPVQFKTSPVQQGHTSRLPQCRFLWSSPYSQRPILSLPTGSSPPPPGTHQVPFSFRSAIAGYDARTPMAMKRFPVPGQDDATDVHACLRRRASRIPVRMPRMFVRAAICSRTVHKRNCANEQDLPI